MRYHCVVNGQEIDFSLEKSDGHLRLSPNIVNGGIDIRGVGKDLYHLIGAGESRLLAVTRIGSGYRITIRGEAYPVKLEDHRSYLRRIHGGQKSSQRTVGRISAPIPGMVVRVVVSEGDEVKKGQPLLALEAMKMENEIKSPVSGRVVKISVSQGESVAKDTFLMAIE